MTIELFDHLCVINDDDEDDDGNNNEKKNYAALDTAHYLRRRD